MAEFNKSKIVSPFMPTLLHLAIVQIAVLIYSKLRNKALKKCVEKDFWKKVEEVTILMPEDVSDRVIKAFYGLRGIARIWRFHYQSELGLTNRDWVYYWRSNGMINAAKTVQSLVQNVSIDIIKRFHLACQFCMEENIMELWSEMNALGKTKCLQLKRHPISEFWASWIRDGCQVPWRQSFQGFMHNRRDWHFIARFSAYLPELPLEERRKFLKSLKATDGDDYVHSLYALTKEEEDEILKQNPLKLLVAYSNWPLQGLLVETADKMWSCLSEDYVRDFIRIFFLSKENSKDFDYSQLFIQSWDKIPVSFRERAKQDPIIKQDILVWLGYVTKERKANLVKSRNKKRAIEKQIKRRNGETNKRAAR